MIRVRRSSGTTVLEGALEPGVAAYIDAEWLRGAEGCEVPALTVDSGGVLRFARHTWKPPDGVEADRMALLAFSSFAQHAVDALPEPDRGPITVTGDGIAAAEVRRVLGAPPASSPGIDHPAAVIDTTGDPDVLVGATRRLADGGVVVLAGECVGRRTDVNLYPDVHLRGLRLVGLGPLLSQEPPGGDLAQRRNPQDSLEIVAWGEPLPGAAWYRLDA